MHSFTLVFVKYVLVSTGCFSLDFKREFKRCCCISKVRREEAAARIHTQNSIYRSGVRTSTRSRKSEANGIKNQSSRQQLLSTLSSDQSITEHQHLNAKAVTSLDDEIEVLSETPLCDNIQNI